MAGSSAPDHPLWHAALPLAPRELAGLIVGDEPGRAARDIPAGLDLFRAARGFAPLLESASGRVVGLLGQAGRGRVVLLQLAPDKVYDLPATPLAADVATRLLLNLLACTLDPPAVPPAVNLHPAPPRAITGRVFWDADDDGTRDEAEDPAAGVTLSLDHRTIRADRDGGFAVTLRADRTARLAVHPPAGARAPPTMLLHGWDPPGATLELPLTAAPERRAEHFSFVALTDTHLLDGRLAADRQRLAARLAALEAEAPAFGLLLGDNAGTAGIAELRAVREIATAAPFPVFVVPGNHDLTRGPDTAYRHRREVGPLVRAVDWGRLRILLGRDFGRNPAARAWLTRELARSSPDRILVVAQHHPPTPELTQRLADAGVPLLLHGHVHRRGRSHRGGLTVLSLPPALFGGLDRSASGYAQVSVDGRKVTAASRTWPAIAPAAASPHAVNPHAVASHTACPRAASLTAANSDAEDKHAAGSDAEGKHGTGLCRWRRDLGTELRAAPAANATTLYLPAAGSADGAFTGVIALDWPTGAERWRTPTAAAVRATPAVDGGRLFTLTAAGELLALGTTDGHLAWRRPPPPAEVAPALAAPVLGPGAVLRATPLAPACFAAATGHPRWRAGRLEGSRMPSFAGGAWTGDVVLISSLRHGLVALNTDDGTIRWQVRDRFPSTAPPASDGTRAYASTARELKAFDLQTGEPLWTAALPMARHTVAPLPSGELVLQATGNGVLVAAEAETGAERWRWSSGPALRELGPYRRGGPAAGAPLALHRDLVLFGADDGWLRALSRVDGSVRWSAAFGDPVSGCLAREELVVVTLHGGEVVALTPGPLRTEP